MRRQIKILMLSPTVGEAFGQERVMHDLSELLRSDGHRVYFLTSQVLRNPPPNDGLLCIEGLEQLHWLSSSATVKSLHQKALGFIENIQPDVIHLIDQFDYRLVRSMAHRWPTVMTSHTMATTCPSSTRLTNLGGICSKKSGFACLWHHQKYRCLSHFKDNLRRLHAIQNYRLRVSALKSIKCMMAISRYVQKALLNEGWPQEKVPLVYNPVQIPVQAEKLKDPPHNLIICASRLVTHKGIRELVHTMALIRDLPWTLWVCGEGPLSSTIAQQIRDRKLTDRIFLKGRLNSASMEQALNSSQFVIQPNIGPEPFGLSVAEALAHKKPIISYDLPAINEIVEHGKTGLLASPGDDVTLAKNIRCLLLNPDLAQVLGANGPGKIQKSFSPSRHLERTLGVYSKAMQPSPIPKLNNQPQWQQV